uniref:Uncharacterized protein n=1 Tax=Hyaloperonospora arabidopsidis (strain Emoy2) TaxID=559515 RepID=M4C3E1_HYAAE
MRTDGKKEGFLVRRMVHQPDKGYFPLLDLLESVLRPLRPSMWVWNYESSVSLACRLAARHENAR